MVLFSEFNMTSSVWLQHCFKIYITYVRANIKYTFWTLLYNPLCIHFASCRFKLRNMQTENIINIT